MKDLWVKTCYVCGKVKKRKNIIWLGIVPICKKCYINPK